MAIVISVTNQKGGVGKTVTVSTMAAVLTGMGYKVLTIDLDPQRNLDMSAGAGALIPIGDTESRSILHVMQGSCTMREAVFPCDIGDLVRASSLLSQWTGRPLLTVDEAPLYSEKELYTVVHSRLDQGWGRNDSGVLAEKLEEVRNDYDFILMDTNPSLMALTVNSLCACDYVLVPAFAERSSLEAIRELWDTIQTINRYNSWHQIRIAGILITKYRKNISIAQRYKAWLSQQAQKIGTIVFDTTIRDNVTVLEYMNQRSNLLKYQPRGRATQDYRQFVDEFLERIHTLEKERGR